MDEIQSYINNVINKRINSGEVLKHVRGVVEGVDENNEYAVVDIGNREVTIVNKSGEELAVNDEVTIYYWTNINNGWIAIRHGLANLNAKSLSINSAAVMSTSQSDKLTVETNTIATYENLIAKYGADENSIIINGFITYPISISETSLMNKDDFYKAMVRNAKVGYKEVIFDELNADNSVIEEKYSEILMLKTWDSDSMTWDAYDGCVRKSTKEVVMPKYVWQYKGSASLKLFYKTIYSPLSGGNADYFPYGCADIIVARSSTNSNYTPDYITATVGFKSEEEYNYAVTVTTKSEVEKA